MTCPCCQKGGGTYSFNCLDCCARLVLTTHPDKALAMSMLAAIERYRQKWSDGRAPKREDILGRMRQMQSICDPDATQPKKTKAG